MISGRNFSKKIKSHVSFQDWQTSNTLMLAVIQIKVTENSQARNISNSFLYSNLGLSQSANNLKSTLLPFNTALRTPCSNQRHKGWNGWTGFFLSLWMSIMLLCLTAISGYLRYFYIRALYVGYDQMEVYQTELVPSKWIQMVITAVIPL